MARAKKVSDSPELETRPAARTPESRENELIALAYDLAEERIRNKTASAQEITHFLKLGSTNARLEREILAEQKKLVTAKTESLESTKRLEEVYVNAMKAFRAYSGNGSEELDDQDLL